MITVSDISKILYETDLAGTTCRVNNGMEDEYDSEAKEIYNIISDVENQLSFQEILKFVMEKWFYCGVLKGKEKGCMIAEHNFNKINK